MTFTFWGVQKRQSTWSISVTGEMCVFSLWDCEGREDFRIHLYPGSWGFGINGLGRLSWANRRGDIKGQFWSNNPSAATGDALSLFMDGSLSREQNTMGDPDHFGDDSNDKPSQAKGVSRLVIYLSPSDGYPLLPYLAWLWGKLNVCRPGGLEPCSMSVGVSAPLTVEGDVALRDGCRAPFVDWANIRPTFIYRCITFHLPWNLHRKTQTIVK